MLSVGKESNGLRMLPQVTEIGDKTHVTCHTVDDNPETIKHTETAGSNSTETYLDQASLARSRSSHSCVAREPCHADSCRPIEESPNGSGRTSPTRPSFEGIGNREDHLRQEACGFDIPASVAGRPNVGSVVHLPLSEQSKAGSSEVPHVCGKEGERIGTTGSHYSQDQWRDRHQQSIACATTSQDDSKGQEQDPPSGDAARGGNLLDRRGVRCDRELSIAGSAGCCCLANPNAQPRERTERDHRSSEESTASVDVDEARTLLLAGDHDVDFPEHLEPFCSGLTEKAKFRRLIQQYENEYHEVKKETRDKPKTSIDLLEVFCSNHSSLTNQANQQGLTAQRFTIETGDLHSVCGRKELFRKMITHNPANLWFSPECRPWSAWSFLNGSLSRDAWTKLYADRLKGLEQVALGIVLFRIQLSAHRHMHWEQPSRSLMFRLPHMQEVFAYTKMAEFDLCNVADYHDPVTRRSIKKGLSVCTTSQKLFDLLHGHKCRHDHEHQTIEGTTTYQGKRISRSRFTENYPRKFVRQIVQLWLRIGRSEVPFADMILASTIPEADGPALKRPRIRAAPPVAPRWIEPSDLPCLKRRKLDKQADATPMLLNELERVFQLIDEQTPRVGKVTHHSHEDIIQKIQKWFPEKKLILGVSCRGTDRLQPPPKELSPAEAPYRITLCSHRTNGKIFVTEQWEEWQHLAQRQLIRTSGCPSRLSITVFASIPEISSGVPSQERMTNGSSDSIDVIKEPSESIPESNKSHATMDCQSHRHGSRFLALSSEEKQIIIKCHKNLGHPSAERLKVLMKQQSFRPEMIEAIDDYRCSVCLETKGPMLSRPSAIREPLDFNDRVSMDGINWKNKQGTSFHFYHVVDQATSFHVAGIAPNRTTDQVIQFLASQWISWAGPPNGLTVDAATELNSNEMDEFCQGLNIRKNTISPEAHWQNSRVERHGQVLQHMLTKYQEEHPILTYPDLQVALAVCVAAKNASAVKNGFTPELLVLGKRTRLPGSICGDDCIASHALAESDLLQGAQFRSQLAKREAAFRAFWEADNNAALRRALLRRSRPFRGQYAPGEWVMIWRQAEPPKGQWLGPMKVVTQESAQIIWCTRSGRLYRCSPEQVRPVSAYEARDIPKEESNLDVKPSIGEQLSELQRQNNQEQYQDLAGNSSDGIDVSGPPPINHSGNDPTNIQPTNPESSSPVDVEHDSVVEPDNEPGASSEISEPGPSPENVPIPESEDENLHCTALICHDNDDPSPMELGENQVWQAEILVCQEDIDHWRQCDESTAASFLATTAKRQRVEVKVKDLQPEEKIEMDKAKQSEITNWLSTGTVEKMLRSQVPPSQVMRCRWILTWKPIDEETRLMSENPSKDRKAKARIVVLGFMDPSLDQLQRDSPTMSRLSRMLVLQMVASRRWNLMSFDIRTAFLQGQPQKDRLLAIEPVQELASAMKLQSHEICKLTKSAYGLVDAPFLWYQALKKQLIQLEFQESPFCPCTFVLRNPQTQETEGVLGIHVDDGIGAGNQRFQAKIAELEKVFPFGSKKMGKFTFTGIDIQQNADHSISMSQSLYVRNIKAIAIDPERRSKPDEVVTSSEQQDLRALVGSLQYASVHTRPDISSRLSYLQSTINKACVKDLIEGNKVLHETKKEHDLKITIQSIRCEDLRFLMFSDASFSSPKVPDSHAGNIILATHKDIASNCQCPISPLSWGCKKIQRVVVSTLAAETMAMTSALDQLSWLRLYWAWLLNPNCNWQQPEQALAKLPQSYATATYQSQQLPADLAVTDCKSLYDLVTRAAPPNCQEYRTMLHARSIKEMLQEGVQMRWVHSGAQLADALTKVMKGTFLRATLRAGHYKLHDELEVLKSRSNSRNRIRWLKSGECSDACCLQQF